MGGKEVVIYINGEWITEWKKFQEEHKLNDCWNVKNYKDIYEIAFKAGFMFYHKNKNTIDAIRNVKGD